jgi:hypothetical protein
MKWIRLVPDQPGKGGMKTGIHSFQVASINDTRVVTGFHVWQGAWKIDDGHTVYAPQTPATSLLNTGLHGYVYPNLNEPGADPGFTILGHEIIVGHGFTYYDYTHGTVRDGHYGTGVLTSTNVPATFLNIGGRCFIFDGAREGFIADDRTPAIHAQANQNLGIETPDMAPAMRFAPYPGVGMVYAHWESPYLTTPNADSPIGTLLSTDTVTPFLLNASYPWLAGAGLMAAGSPLADAVTSNTTPLEPGGTISCVSGSSKVTLGGANWGSNWKECGLRINFAGYSFVLYETYENTGGSNVCFDIDGNTVTLAAGEALFWGVYDGPTVTNVPYTLSGCRVNMPATSDSAMLNSTINYLGYSQATACRTIQAGVRESIKYLGNMSWSAGEAPSYAYAFYDPETGHISNLSPMTPMDQSAVTNVTPWVITGLGYISHVDGTVTGAPPTAGTDAARFSHIVFFRTLTGGGSTYFPIGSLQPYIGKVHPGLASTRGSWNPDWVGIPNMYSTIGQGSFYDFSTDDDLLLTAGLIGPLYTNDKPIVTLAGGIEQPGWPYAAAYWDERLWLVNKQEPDKIVFSCDSAQCPFGVPEESFPATNFLRLPSEDGKVTGMKLIAEMLLITTMRYAYTVVGNNESNYRLVRVSTRMAGVTTRMMDDFPSDVEDQPSLIYYLGTDKNIYEWIPGMNANVISREINDVLQSAKISPKYSFVHCISAWGRRCVVVVLLDSDQSIVPGKVLFFDVEGRRWTQNPPNALNSVWVPQSMTTIYGTSTAIPIDELYASFYVDFNHVQVYRWIKNDAAVSGGGMNAEITTFPMTFDGKKNKKQLCMVNVHSVSPTAPLTWLCRITVDESTAKVYDSTMAAYPDPIYSIYGTPTASVDGSNPQDVVTLSAAFGTTDNAPPTGYRFAVSIYPQPNNPPTNSASIMAIDIGYRDYADDNEVDP